MSPERLEAMGVDVLVGGATSDELEAIGFLFQKLDRTFSRFRSNSELNRVNAATAEFVAASPMFVRVLALALDAARRTDGLVDPTLGAAIEAAGYDRDFAELADDERPPSAAVPGSWRHVRVAGPLVFRYPGTKLDLNCVVKGLAVDAAVQQLAGDGFVAAGGDVAVRGAAGVGLPGGGSLTLRRPRGRERVLASRSGARQGGMTLFEWYLARASGIVAFVLLTIAVVLGLTLSGRAKLPNWPRFAVEDVHRFAGLLTGTFVSLHVLTLFVDSYLPFSLTQLVVPGTSSYRPLSTALGVVVWLTAGRAKELVAASGSMPLSSVTASFTGTAVNMLRVVALTGLGIALADYMVVRIRTMKKGTET